MCVDRVASRFDLVRRMQSDDNLQNAWMMFNHVKCVQGWTMACHISNSVYCKVMMIVVCDMQFENMEVHCILWRKLNVVVEKKGLGTPTFKGFMANGA
jgi:hypothetical protein